MSRKQPPESLPRDRAPEGRAFRVAGGDAGARIDRYLADKLTEQGGPGSFSRSAVQRLLDEGMVLLNGGRCAAHRRLKPGDLVQVTLPPPRETGLRPADIPLDIMYQDGDLLVINKQAGLPVHPSPGHEQDTLVNALIHRFGETGMLSDIGGELRPGIVHRLDKDTAGVTVVARTNRAHRALSEDFASRRVRKVYEAIVKGEMRGDRGTVDQPLARSIRNRKKFAVAPWGRRAVTEYRVLERRGGTTWVELFPRTGRTHQLRVHLAYLGHPILGDPVYARRSSHAGCLALFARELGFTHPVTGRELTFTAPHPPHFLDLARRLGYRL
ncbi:MAG: RluA family pseudouridine synthase [Spirochaetota bacterium]